MCYKTVTNIKEIKLRANVRDTIKYLGIDIDNQNMINCPLHNEKIPSFNIYAEDSLWICFGKCQTGGDSIRLVQLYKGITWLEAVQEVANLNGIVVEYSK